VLVPDLAEAMWARDGLHAVLEGVVLAARMHSQHARCEYYQWAVFKVILLPVSSSLRMHSQQIWCILFFGQCPSDAASA
jgi:hypothetical protein